MISGAQRPVPAVGVAVVRDGDLLLVRRGRGANAGLWAIPGGKVEYGESMRAAAIREVREETGIDVELGEVIWVGDALGPGDPPAWHYTLVDYSGQMIGGALKAADDAREVAWISLKSALELPLTPTMPDLVAVLLEETHDSIG